MKEFLDRTVHVRGGRWSWASIASIALMLTATVTAHAADPLGERGREPIPVRVHIEVPASMTTVRLGLRLGSAGAVVESSGQGFNLLLRSGSQAERTPTPMDRLERFLDRSPLNIGDFGPAEPGLQIELFHPGDFGASIRYRW
ncbi:MAG: hypothetical protein HY699_11025 [Deltaproteobacteria bacterium]|nr:hypothetical protein [Deltaproteobacteria bacterium]